MHVMNPLSLNYALLPKGGQGVIGRQYHCFQHEQICSQRDNLHVVCKTHISIRTRFIRLYKLRVLANEIKAVSAPGCAFDRLTKKKGANNFQKISWKHPRDKMKVGAKLEGYSQEGLRSRKE